jgi:AcrR family transcriptional regulator
MPLADYTPSFARYGSSMAAPKRPATDTRRTRSRQTIIAATSRVLADKGLNLMTVEDILQEAGVARATFYSHFTDKNDATGAVVEQMFLRAEKLYASFHNIKAITPAEISTWLTDAYEQWRTYQSEVSSLVRDFANLFRGPQFSQLDSFAEILVGTGDRFACPRDTALLRARLLIVQLERAMLDTVSGSWPVSRSELVAELTPMWIDALTRPA